VCKDDRKYFSRFYPIYSFYFSNRKSCWRRHRDVSQTNYIVEQCAKVSATTNIRSPKWEYRPCCTFPTSVTLSIVDLVASRGHGIRRGMNKHRRYYEDSFHLPSLSHKITQAKSQLEMNYSIKCQSTGSHFCSENRNVKYKGGEVHPRISQLRFSTHDLNNCYK
jgi:hypothetical protein